MTTGLPRFIGLKSVYNDQYLRYVYENLKTHGFLQFSGDEVVSPYCKFEVERAKTGNGLVHLRCSYNNKYWTRSSETEYWIFAGRDEPEEDQSLWTCTLFEPIQVDSLTIRLRHVQLGNYVCLWRVDLPYGSCAFAGDSEVDQDKCDVFNTIDWESLLILPKHIAFKGDNGKYLSAQTVEGYPYLEFSGDDIGDPRVGNEVFTTSDGNARIKSDYFGKFWRRSPNWIWADSDDTTTNNSDTLFWPVKLDNNVVALRNLGNNNFCKRLTTEGKTSCLNAGIATIDQCSHLQIEELVISRDIYNVDYRLMDARVYDQNVLTIATGTAVNKTQVSDTIDLKLSYTDTKSSTWNASVSLKLAVKTTLEAGIPRMEEGKIDISVEFTGAYSWGETETTSTEIDTVYTVTVPAMSTVKVSLIATKGSCDVPYSYDQRDTLTNGDQVTYHMDDGVFIGMNSFNFQYKTEQESL